MAKRISQLTELTTAAPEDYIPIVDQSSGQTKRITVDNLVGIPDVGWTAAGETWTYASATTITVPSDATTKYSKGNFIKVTQTTGGTKYGIITNVTATVLTVYWLSSATLANEAISSPFYSPQATPIGVLGFTPVSIHNDIKFSVYRSAALTSSNSVTKVDHDATQFDTGGDVTTNDRFTAPIAGFYFFSAMAGNTAASGTSIFAYLFKNGALALHGSGDKSATGVYANVSGILQLAAGDYVEHFFVGGGGSTMDVGEGKCYFQGFLLSRT